MSTNVVQRKERGFIYENTEKLIKIGGVCAPGRKSILYCTIAQAR